MTTLAPSFLIGSSLFLQVTRTTINGFEIRQDPIRDFKKLATLEHLEKSPKTYNGRIVVTTLVPSFLDGSSCK